MEVVGRSWKKLEGVGRSGRSGRRRKEWKEVEGVGRSWIVGVLVVASFEFCSIYFL